MEAGRIGQNGRLVHVSAVVGVSREHARATEVTALQIVTDRV